jgi:hypothetical protein
MALTSSNFARPQGNAGDFNPSNRDGCDQALSGAHALWAIRAEYWPVVMTKKRTKELRVYARTAAEHDRFNRRIVYPQHSVA